jgi:hypothetical protein
VIGPGKYDDECTAARLKTGARGVLLIITGGDRGDGFSCQADAATLRSLPDILEQVAADIRRTGPFGPVRKG